MGSTDTLKYVETKLKIQSRPILLLHKSLPTFFVEYFHAPFHLFPLVPFPLKHMTKKKGKIFSLPFYVNRILERITVLKKNAYSIKHIKICHRLNLLFEDIYVVFWSISFVFFLLKKYQLSLFLMTESR